MAYEATLVFETHPAIPFTCANGTAITQGSLVKLTDPLTVAITAGAADICGGITIADKIASDGKVKVGVYRGGIFKVYLSGSCDIGDALTTDSVVNMVKSVGLLTDIQLSGSRIWGIALEAGATGETILMELRPQAQGRG